MYGWVRQKTHYSSDGIRATWMAGYIKKERTRVSCWESFFSFKFLINFIAALLPRGFSLHAGNCLQTWGHVFLWKRCGNRYELVPRPLHNLFVSVFNVYCTYTTWRFVLVFSLSYNGDDRMPAVATRTKCWSPSKYNEAVGRFERRAWTQNSGLQSTCQIS